MLGEWKLLYMYHKHHVTACLVNRSYNILYMYQGSHVAACMLDEWKLLYMYEGCHMTSCLANWLVLVVITLLSVRRCSIMSRLVMM